MVMRGHGPLLRQCVRMSRISVSKASRTTQIGTLVTKKWESGVAAALCSCKIQCALLPADG